MSQQTIPTASTTPAAPATSSASAAPASSATPNELVHRHLSLVETQAGTIEQFETGTHGGNERCAHRGIGPDQPGLMAACAGVPMRLTKDETDFVDLINAASSYTYLLDPQADLDTTHPAVYAAEYVLTHHGLDGHAGGRRIKGVESSHRRYVLPFLVEVAWAKPENHRGVAHLRMPEMEMLPRILAGRHPLPAATVAADRLRGRKAIECLYLSLADVRRDLAGSARASWSGSTTTPTRCWTTGASHRRWPRS